MKPSAAGHDLNADLLPLKLHAPSLPQSCLAWVTPSTQLHSSLAPSSSSLATICQDAPPRPGHCCTGGGGDFCLSRRNRNGHDHQPIKNLQPNQLGGHQLCDSAIASVFVCLLFVATRRQVESGEGLPFSTFCHSSEACRWHL